MDKIEEEIECVTAAAAADSSECVIRKKKKYILYNYIPVNLLFIYLYTCIKQTNIINSC